MDRMLKQLDVIRGVSERLLGLSQSRAVPENIVKSLQEESESIKWAHKELRKLHVTDSLLIIGHSSVLSRIYGLPIEEVNHYETDPDIGYAVLIAPEQIMIEQITEFFGTKGNDLLNGTIPEWVRCRKYFACCNTSDIMKRAVLFDCVLLRQWLNENGTKSVKSELKRWMYQIFNAIKWDEATPSE